MTQYIPVYNHSQSNNEEGGQAFLSKYENILTERQTARATSLN
jgi:hypothetical protein